MSKANRARSDWYIKRLLTVQQSVLGWYIKKFGLPKAEEDATPEDKEDVANLHLLLEEVAIIANQLGLVKGEKEDE